LNNKFSSLKISTDLVQLLSQNRITDPTPIQQQTIPVLLEGKDVIAQAQTGTGKTLAFLLPIMQMLNTSDNYVQALIITPTRELAIQITQVARMLAEANGANILAAYGGQDVQLQKRKLKNSIHIVIGTPGRLLDHIKRKSVNFTRIKTLVIDEADRTLDMGFLRDVEQIIHSTARHRQTVLCSATMPGGIAALAEKYLNSPLRIHAAGKTVTLENIRQIAVETTDKNKQDTLCSLIDEYKPFMAIIFCRTKRRTQTVNRVLNARGYLSDELHGNLTQGKREKAMKAFRETKIQYLVATDIAARGIDVEGITHIFNYDLPGNSENYIHRIGRTGRAGQEGFAITFFTREDRKDLSLIERGIKSTIDILAFNKVKTGNAVPQKDVSGQKTVSRNAERKPYTSKPADRHTGSVSKKFSSRKKPFSNSSDSIRDVLSKEKGYSFNKKSADRRSDGGSYSDKRNYKYGDRKSFSSKYGIDRKNPDAQKMFKRESENAFRKGYDKNRNSSGGNNFNSRSTGNRTVKDSRSYFAEDRKKKLYPADAGKSHTLSAKESPEFKRTGIGKQPRRLSFATRRLGTDAGSRRDREQRDVR
jgi:ATP-dependent RNA helicase DeaD